LLIVLVLMSIAMVDVAIASPELSITVSTDKEFYYLRQKVTINGNLVLDASPVPNGSVALQINGPGDFPIIFRTLSTGTTPPSGLVKIVDVIPMDGPPPDWNPKNEFKRGEWLYLNVTGRNDDTDLHSILLTACLYDGNQNPIGLSSPTKFTVDRNSNFYQFPRIWIPKWAFIGNATVYANVYTDFPRNGGTPYSPEAAATIQIISVETSPSTVQSSYNSAGTETLQTNGSYFTIFKVSPEPAIGQYGVYVSSNYGGWMAYKSTSFEVKSASYPPDASFIYTPPKAYVNMTVTFDASASTPNGGSIINYTWNFGDGTPIKTYVGAENYTATHVYKWAGTYTVTLNVTDSEGLWGVDMKPITIWPPEGPIARFSWTPPSPYVNQTVTFDASASRPGWNGTGWAPIVRYTWNFKDGNITIIGDNEPVTPTITHVYRAEGNYTVSLNVTDTQGLWSFTDTLTLWNQSVPVSNRPKLEGDVNGDNVVDIFDVVIVAAAFGSRPGDPNWDARADLRPEFGLIDIFDFMIVAAHFGESI